MSHSKHGLILGVQGSGKSVVGHKLAQQYIREGVGVLVLNPHGELWPGVPQQHIFTDPYKFLAVARKSKRCALFIEEAGECIGRGSQARDMQWLTTGSRKYGHVAYLIAQEAQQILPTIRKQCRVGFIFRQSQSNAALLANDFADERLLQACNLKAYEFLHIETCGECKKLKFRR